MAFYENFKSICESKGLSLGSVCIACGLSESIHSKWKTSIPKSDVIIKLSEYLDVSADYLLCGKERFAPISDDERNLLDKFNSLSEQDKGRILERIDILAQNSECD